MTAYVILIREKLRDEAAMKKYAEAAAGARGDHKIPPLAFYGACETTEGAAADGVVLLSFPTMAEAKAWYTSPEEKEAKKNRGQAAEDRGSGGEGGEPRHASPAGAGRSGNFAPVMPVAVDTCEGRYPAHVELDPCLRRGLRRGGRSRQLQPPRTNPSPPRPADGRPRRGAGAARRCRGRRGG